MSVHPVMAAALAPFLRPPPRTSALNATRRRQGLSVGPVSLELAGMAALRRAARHVERVSREASNSPTWGRRFDLADERLAKVAVVYAKRREAVKQFMPRRPMPVCDRCGGRGRVADAPCSCPLGDAGREVRS